MSNAANGHGPLDLRRRGLEFLLVLLVPVLAAFVGLEYWFADSERAATRELDEQLERQLRIAVFGISPTARLNASFEALYRSLVRVQFKTTADSPQLSWPAPEMKALTVVFPEQGPAFAEPGGTLPPRFALARLWSELRAGQTSSSYLAMYRTFLGRRIRMNAMLEARHGAVPINDSMRPCCMRWQATPGGAGLLMALPTPPDDLSLAAATVRELFPDGNWALFDPSDGRTLGGASDLDWVRIILQSTESTGSFVANGHLCRVRRHPCGIWLLRALPAHNVSRDPQRRGSATTAVTLLLAIAALWCWRANWTPLGRVRLAGRVLATYMVPVVLPASLILSIGMSSLRGREAMLIDDMHRQSVARLAGVDQAFREWDDGMVDQYRKLRDLPVFRGRDAAAGRRLSATLHRRGLVYMLKTFARDGTKIMDFNPAGEGPWFDHMPAYMLPRYLGVPRADVRINVDPVYADVICAPRGFAGFLDNPDAIVRSAVGREQFRLYFDCFEASGTGTTALFMLDQKVSDDAGRFLGRHLPVDCDVFDNYYHRWRSPQRRPALADALVAAALVGCEPTRAIDGDGAEPRLWSAYPSRELADCCLVTSRPLRPVTDAVDALRLLFIALIGITCALLITVTALLTGEMLGPINAITRGLSALEHRDLAARLPAMPYEFGVLADAFNRMMAERQDLDLAREVQQHIMPRETPHIPGYGVAFSCRSLSDVGGDYCDIMRYADGRWLLLVGDVTGHGMGAALVTTMVKTGSLITARRGEGLDVLIARLNQMVFGIMRRTANVTLAAMLLDPVRHEITWALAGHPSPILRLPDGSTRELAMPGFPLGCVARRVVHPESVAMAPGSLLVTYTDGYVEATNAAEDQLGYMRWEAAIAHTPTATAQGTHDHLVAIREAHAGPTPANDDLTLLALARGQG